MAYIGKEEYSPVWLPESLPEEMLAESFLEMINTQAQMEHAPPPEEPNFGFIIRDWFGPFLLSPPTYCLRGHC